MDNDNNSEDIDPSLLDSPVQTVVCTQSGKTSQSFEYIHASARDYHG